MKRKISKYIFSAFLTATILNPVCVAASAAESTETKVQAGVTEYAENEGVRYQVEWAKDAVIYEVNVRQYTEEGTFHAFSENLQTLKDMGITTLWFMPIHPISQNKRSGTLGSYYSITDYREVNPEFGTSEDFRDLVEKAHEMGFTVIMDWVANHTGWDCKWIKEHPDWYTRGEDGEITEPLGMGWPDVADLNYDNPELWAEMIDCMKFWVTEYDVDGFRCDYANGVPTEFWETARAEIEMIKPVLMLAEDNTVEELLEYAFDMNYNWELYDALLGIAADTKRANVIKYYIPEDYPDNTYCLNFLDNHDKNAYENTIISAFGMDSLPLMWSLIYTLPGTPLVYTGDEIGLNHNIAFTEHDPVDWESSDVNYRPLLAELAAIRSENPALHSGKYGGAIQYVEMGNKSVFAFTRERGSNEIISLFNMSKREMEIDVSVLFDGNETVLLHGVGADLLEMEDYTINISGKVTLQPWEYYIVSDI